MEIGKNSTVTWINGDSVVHTITSSSVHDGSNGIFDSGQLIPGKTFSHVFKTVDSFEYFCTIYPS